ncbi:hypothetical protein VFPFJ_01866 [Purpureocillium lilacinum]|uniref:Uncharacterized protein n=1 Tax=Purpureocillium lilacinum TaxID=33203 RepID=A0A179G1P9_PURLI|nr:hypothetical protein VFPFJ_01866 [Purpureocillium lilacinum]OAQ71637.1 hypothetical protein VFPBJ_10416 [Purpureocillium lilacinum]OAQ92705.1 hypothetical protein VFPFJ_01866 [Purpureocillium lilacinum]PWI72081.1 hypothetical protein PCL_10704 [Purpureocillium lilacinum]GJN71216.1 hypothetical protein PLICBS_005278 [Purpureocillium lilacinum]GJN82907.1 hypothetical protein PLIIFM63780_006453 [Purpureocillium lilacinum]
MAENNNNNHGRDNEANAALSPAIQLLVKEMAADPDNALSAAEDMITRARYSHVIPEWNKARGLEDATAFISFNSADVMTAVEEIKKKHGVDSVTGIIVPNRNSHSRQQPTASGGQDGATVPVQGNDNQNE